MPHKGIKPYSNNSDSCAEAAEWINHYGPDGLNTIVKQGPSEDAGANLGKSIKPSEVK